MFKRNVVQKALRQTWALDDNPGGDLNKPSDDQNSMTSRLIYDILGGEILKIRNKKGWHFYNRINGKRIDFTGSELIQSSGDHRLKELPSTPDETFDYFAQEDYSTLFIRFISFFEEAVGLEKYRPHYTQ